MGILKKILQFLKDFGLGLLYLGLTAGLMLLIAGAMLKFKPQDAALDAASLPLNPAGEDALRGMRLMRLGAAAAVASAAALWLQSKLSKWWRRRKRRAEKAATDAAAAAEAAAAKEGA